MAFLKPLTVFAHTALLSKWSVAAFGKNEFLKSSERHYMGFLVLWDCGIQHLYERRVALNPGLGGVTDVASAIISHEQTHKKTSLLFSNFGCCTSKGSLFRLFKLLLLMVDCLSTILLDTQIVNFFYLIWRLSWTGIKVMTWQSWHLSHDHLIGEHQFVRFLSIL